MNIIKCCQHVDHADLCLYRCWLCLYRLLVVNVILKLNNFLPHKLTRDEYHYVLIDQTCRGGSRIDSRGVASARNFMRHVNFWWKDNVDLWPVAICTGYWPKARLFSWCFAFTSNPLSVRIEQLGKRLLSREQCSVMWAYLSICFLRS